MRNLRPKAFTLIEVLGSMVILGAAIVGIIICSADGLAASKDLERRVKSTLLAGSEVDRIKGSLIQDFSQTYVDNHVDLGNSYRAKNSCKNVSGRPELKKIEVSVGYDTDGSASLGGSEIMFNLDTMAVDQ